MLEINIATQSDIDRHNVSNYRRGNKPTEARFYCISCRKQTSIEDSYSSGGHKLHCRSCVDKFAKAAGMSTTYWLRLKVWDE